MLGFFPFSSVSASKIDFSMGNLLTLFVDIVHKHACTYCFMHSYSSYLCRLKTRDPYCLFACILISSPAEIRDVHDHKGNDCQLHWPEQDHRAHLGLHSEDGEFDSSGWFVQDTHGKSDVINKLNIHINVPFSLQKKAHLVRVVL